MQLDPITSFVKCSEPVTFCDCGKCFVDNAYHWKGQNIYGGLWVQSVVT